MLIFNKLIELRESGALDWDKSSIIDGRSDSKVTFLAYERSNYKSPTVRTVLEEFGWHEVHGERSYKQRTASTI